MSTGLHPTVRYLIPCQAILIDADDPTQVTLVNLHSALRATGEPPFLLPDFSVFVELTECRGTASVRLEITDAEEEQELFRTDTRPAELPSEPLTVCALTFRIRALELPALGLYGVRFAYNEVVLARRALVIQ